MLTIEGLHLRAALFRSIRNYFHDLGFLEVDTPIRYPVLLPERHIVPVRSGSWYLQPSPEQCMKRLLSRGCSAIFQICPCFRGEERGRHHLPEFMMLEWYRKGGNYRDLMTDCEGLIHHVLAQLGTESVSDDLLVTSPLNPVTLRPPWERITVADAFDRYCPESVAVALAKDRFEQLLVEYIEPNLGVERPCFLVDYPAECASLARLKRDDPAVAERFELYIAGIELANGFTELTDADQQRARFVLELPLDDGKNDNDRRLPERFLEELPLIGSAAGIAFGIDRFLMLLLSAESIDAAVSFTPEALG